jgi:hypothetical protein
VPAVGPELAKFVGVVPLGSRVPPGSALMVPVWWWNQEKPQRSARDVRVDGASVLERGEAVDQAHPLDRVSWLIRVSEPEAPDIMELATSRLTIPPPESATVGAERKRVPPLSGPGWQTLTAP